MMEAVSTSETSGNRYQTDGRNIPEDGHFKMYNRYFWWIYSRIYCPVFLKENEFSVIRFLLPSSGKNIGNMGLVGSVGNSLHYFIIPSTKFLKLSN
jgi:hypothetical protein